MTTAQANSTDAAIQQIRQKQYDAPFRGQGKPIYLLGILFDKASRNISQWAVEQSSK